MSTVDHCVEAAAAASIDARITDWIARLGAAGAADVAGHLGIGAAQARARLAVCVRRGLLRRVRLLDGEPALYVATAAGLRAMGLGGLAPCRVSASGFAHLAGCAKVAVALERGCPGLRVAGERELRLAERRAGVAVASAELGRRPDGSAALHRPDLVVFGGGGDGPVAVEVELTIKAPARLREIVRAWARCRLVDRVVYVAPPAPARAVGRAVDGLRASDRIVVVALGELLAGRASEAIAIAA